MKEIPPSYAGIDVSKMQLDTAVDQEGKFWQSANDKKGIAITVAKLKELQPTLIVVESTGGLEINLLTALYKAHLPFCRVHPGRVREFARSIGLLAKTDRLDAEMPGGDAGRPANEAESHPLRAEKACNSRISVEIAPQRHLPAGV